MQDKLEILLNTIKLDKTLLDSFKDGKLVKIVGNKNKDSYRFYLELKHELSLDVYKTLCDLLHKRFKEYKKISISIKYSDDKNSYFEDYYHYFMDIEAKGSPVLSMIKDNKLVNNTVQVANKAEEKKLKEALKEVLKSLKTAGYDVEIDVVINPDLSIDLEIKEELKVKKDNKIIKKRSKVIFGEEIKTKVTPINNLIAEENNITIEGEVFGEITFLSKPTFTLVTLRVNDGTDSISCKLFTREIEDANKIKDNIKAGSFYKIRGYTKNDKYDRELVLNIRDINTSLKEKEVRVDNSPVKRVELHTHTMMSAMDGITKINLKKHSNELVSKAMSMGYKAVAITDKNGCQAFPIAEEIVNKFNKGKDISDHFKVLYGVELMLIDDTIKIVINPTDDLIMDSEYVVFDLETTGFNAGGGDSIIEIGAAKLKNGVIVDTFSKLINPGKKLPAKITEITGITDAMLEGAVNEEEAMIEFKDWYQDLPLVAHNAKFDMSFINMAYNKYNLGELNNTVIDTLELSRALDNTYARHSLSAIVKRYNVEFDETSHHRADYDAKGTALVLAKMLKKLYEHNYERISDLNKLVKMDEIHKYGRAYHFNMLAINREGLKNMYHLVSLANTKYLYKTPRILRSEIEKNRNGLLIGSSCYESEIFVEARSKSEEELTNLINFYDYVEVQPLEVYDHLLQMGDFGNKNELIENVKKIIKVTKEAGKIIVATGDVHHFDREDKIYREIIINQKVPGGGRHPLSRSNIHTIPSTHFRTTEEMLEDFNFLDKDLAYEIVVTNTNKIADMIDEIEVIIDTKGKPFAPKIENSAKITEDMVMSKVHELYGDDLPSLVKERVESELKGIIGANYDVIYLIAHKLVKKSNDDGYLVGSRGSVGSSFVATLMGITEVNPLPPHYRCPKCKHSIFDKDNEPLSKKYSSGFDLPDTKCPKCGTLMEKDGQDMPFATFLGFNADKVPDIDLNFSDLNQASAHEYTKELFGEDNVYRAGTIGTAAEKTAYGYVKGYIEDKGIYMREAEIARLANGCTGVKRTTGQHPGGIVVIPDYMSVFEFTPYQYPADDVNALWKTTHFDYHSLESNVLKLDILGHTDPTQLRMIQDLSNIDVTKIPMDDKETMGIFLSPKPLGVTEKDIMCETGTLGIPEFGTQIVIAMLNETKPKTFADLIKISGLSHGTDVWNGNAQELIKTGIPFADVIGCRDDIMVYLMQKGVEPIQAFKIMEFVRKGKAGSDKDTWAAYKEIMEKADIESWYIDSCEKIKYMFPKAHAAAYVMSAYRIAYFKVHYPSIYYASYYSTRFTDFDIDVMIKGYNAIKDRMNEINNKGYEATNKEKSILDTLSLALETTARGFKFSNISLKESDSKNFKIDPNNDKILIPPFRTIDGLGDTVAQKIVEEREKGEFLSIEDLQKRARISGTIIDKMRMMGILDGLDESSQLTLF